jgi:hypothetical protein
MARAGEVRGVPLRTHRWWSRRFAPEPVGQLPAGLSSLPSLHAQLRLFLRHDRRELNSQLLSTPSLAHAVQHSVLPPGHRLALIVQARNVRGSGGEPACPTDLLTTV